MRSQMAKYTQKLIQEGVAVPDSIRFYALDDVLLASREDEYRQVFEAVLSELNLVGLLLAQPPIPFADYLIQRAPGVASRIYPQDSEVKTFLHDIPFIRKEECGEDLAARIAAILRERKGLIVEGVGFISGGTVTLEQAYIVYSSIFHATFVKYLYDVLQDGFILPGEEAAFITFRESWPAPAVSEGFTFRDGPLTHRSDILDEMCAVGRYTVASGLVDSFFGNISLYNDGIIYISQTGASLDELEGLIDPVPVDNSSTCGITASSELGAHRRIYEATGYTTVLHGHPKFAVVMSMLCDKRDTCDIDDCGKRCPETRMLHGIPVVPGEIGAGGIARTVPPAIKEHGSALVYGHGAFCAGHHGFKEAFGALVNIETMCQRRYFEEAGKRRMGKEAGAGKR